MFEKVLNNLLSDGDHDIQSGFRPFNQRQMVHKYGQWVNYLMLSYSLI